MAVKKKLVAKWAKINEWTTYLRGYIDKHTKKVQHNYPLGKYKLNP